jgi:hypothetical protein
MDQWFINIELSELNHFIGIFHPSGMGFLFLFEIKLLYKS